MTPLRQRMIDAMQLRGLAPRTQQSYVRAVAGLAMHYGCSPQQLDGAQVQDYLLHLVRQRHLARSSVNQAGCAFRFLFHTVLEQAHQVQVPLAKSEQRLPCQWSSNNPQLWSSNFPHPSMPRSKRWKWKFDSIPA